MVSASGGTVPPAGDGAPDSTGAAPAPAVEERVGSTWSRVDSLLVAALLVVLVGSSRTNLSFDSHLYLSSAKALVSPDMEAWFHWLREPLFPAVLKATHTVFGTSDLGYVLTVAAIVLASLVVFARVAFPTRTGLRRAFLVVAALNPMVHGYIGHVSQQALMLSGVVFGAAWALREITGPRAGDRASTITAVVLGAALALVSLVMVPVAVAVAAAPLAARFPIGGDHPTLRARIREMGPWTPSVAMVLAAVVALGGWWGYKAATLAEPEANLRLWGFWAWDYELNPGATERAGVDLVDVVRGLTTLGPETQPIEGEIQLFPSAFELRIYGGLDLDWSVDSCGKVDPGLEPAVDYNGDYLTLSCRPSWGQFARELLGGLAVPAHRGALLATLIATPLAMWRRRYLALVLPAVALLLPYVVSGLGISRYSLPIWPLGVAAAAFFAADLLDWRASRRQSGAIAA